MQQTCPETATHNTAKLLKLVDMDLVGPVGPPSLVGCRCSSQQVLGPLLETQGGVLTEDKRGSAERTCAAQPGQSRNTRGPGMLGRGTRIHGRLLQQFCNETGIVQGFTVLYTRQQRRSFQAGWEDADAGRTPQSKRWTVQAATGMGGRNTDGGSYVNRLAHVVLDNKSLRFMLYQKDAF